jgi:hypothetical protein
MNLDAYKQRLLVLQDNIVTSTRHVGRSWQYEGIAPQTPTGYGDPG